MSKFTVDEITKVLDMMVGETEPIGGETNADEKRTENLKTMIKVIDWCMDSLMYSADHFADVEWSKRENALVALKALIKYKEWLIDLKLSIKGVK